MPGLWERIDEQGGEAAVGPRAIPVSVLIARLEEGEPAGSLRRDVGIEAADLVAALAFSALGKEDDEGPPLIRAQPRHPRLSSALEGGAWSELRAGASRPARMALASGLLLIHDFWEAGHEAAQQAGDLGEQATSSYWHAIAHRREPDSGNAAYWLRRVGRHPLFGAIAARAAPLLETQGHPDLARRLIGPGGWNPLAMIELCADGQPRPEVARLARSLQRLEMALLIEATAVEALR